MSSEIRFDESMISNKNDLSELGKKVFNLNYQKKKDISEFTLSDLNNYIGADRKLIINDTNEFWIHDIILINNSTFFNKLLNTKEINPLKTEEVNIEGKKIIKTYINIPHSEFFFDILTWIYSKDIKRLSFIADDQESYLSILSLGVFLGLKHEFFSSIVNACEMKLDEELINSELWSRFQFPFEVLTSLIELMPKENNSLKFFALISWLKEDKRNKKSDVSGKNGEGEEEYEYEDVDYSELDLLTCDDFFKIKDYIKDKKICETLDINDLIRFRKEFPKLLPILDYSYIIDKYVENSKVKISCRICRLQGNDLKIFTEKKCQEKLYHPKKFIQLQRQIISKCNHNGCTKKIAINEFPCCHQQNLGEGCLMSNGHHILSVH
jgi:hypothetical protein